MRLTAAQKKEQRENEEELKKTGLLLREIHASRSSSRALICLIRALLIFLASFGTVGALVSAFELEYHRAAVLTAFLLLSLVTAFLYYNSITFYAGYFALFFLFTFSIFSLYWYVNSGYQAFMNVVFGEYSDYFKLLSVREGTEVITDRSLTISTAMIFVGFLLCLLLNITISGYMSLFATFLITFPLLQIALYINIKPSVPYLAMLVAVYITVGILGRSGHYKVSDLRDRKKLFSRSRKKNHIIHSYLSDGTGMLTTGLYAILLSALFLLATTGIFFRDFDGTRQSKLKAATDESVKAFVQTGIMGLFDRYDATGGLANGNLGGVSSVRPDYQTDLEVTFVPYTTDTIYLKSYIGTYYSTNYFGPVNPSTAISDSSEFTQIFDGFADILQENGTYARMDITNVDAEGYYMPYDSYLLEDNSSATVTLQRNDAASGSSADAINAFHTASEVLTDLEAGTEDETAYSLYYVPFQNKISYEPEETVSEEYEAYVYETYLDIPDFIKPTLDSFCEEAGLWEADDAFSDADDGLYASEEEKEQARRLSLAGKLQAYFINNFDYTMSPGATPYTRDTVEYFLTVQKRGFCAHFASSAALLLREFGIPTRYVEGYCITADNINDASAYSTSTAGWYEGENSLGESGVVTVSVTDAQAHAWVEIYLDGYGWIPFEFTPPSDDEETLTLDFLSIFSSLIRTGDRNQDTDDSDGGSSGTGSDQFQMNFSDSLGFLLKPFLILLGILLLCYLLIYNWKRIQSYFVWRRNLKKERYHLAILCEYQRLLRCYYKRFPNPDHNPPPREFTELLAAAYSASPGSTEHGQLLRLCQAIERAAFSGETLSQADYLELHSSIEELKKRLRRMPKEARNSR